jgi:mRNA interferase RelE/StbE
VPYVLRYHPAVAEDDLPEIPANPRARLAGAIAARLTTEPARYGVPLSGSLRPYWKFRVGDYRVIFRVVGRDVRILAIMHRKRVYEEVQPRLGWPP